MATRWIEQHTDTRNKFYPFALQMVWDGRVVDMCREMFGPRKTSFTVNGGTYITTNPRYKIGTVHAVEIYLWVHFSNEADYLQLYMALCDE